MNPSFYVGTVDSYVLSAASAGNADSSAAASVTTDSDAPYGYCYDHRLFVSAEALEIGTDWDGLHGGSVIFGKPFESGGLILSTLWRPTYGQRSFGGGYGYPGKQRMGRNQK